MDRQDAGRVVALLETKFDLGDTANSYTTMFTDHEPDIAVAFAVVQDWITTQIVGPLVDELLEKCREERARRIKRASAIARGQNARTEGEGMYACTACRDSGWEWQPLDEETKKHDPSYANLETVLPCRVCQPVRHVDWRDGHFRSDHDVTHCEWPVCQQRAEGRAGKPRRRRTRDDRATPASDQRYEKEKAF